MVSRFQSVTPEREREIQKSENPAPARNSLGLCPTRWRPWVPAVSGTGPPRREKNCPVVLIVPDHGEIGMLLVWDDGYWACLSTSSPDAGRPGIEYGSAQRCATVVGRVGMLCSFPCGTRMPCTAVSSNSYCQCHHSE